MHSELFANQNEINYYTIRGEIQIYIHCIFSIQMLQLIS